ncbi:MAG: hypothetical protein WC730_01695 [Patescibacteria group bacterium]|jgi:hypothetical protein
MITERTRFFIRLGIFIAVTCLIAFGLWYLMFNNIPSIIETPEEEIPTETGTLPGSETTEGHATEPTDTPDEETPGTLPEGQVVPAQLTSSEIISPTLTGSDTIAFYNPTDGLFYTIDKAGNIVKLSSDIFPKASTVVFNENADAAVVEFPDGTNVVYDFITQSQTTLPAHWREFTFSSDGENLVAKSIGSVSGNDQLVITSTDGSQAESIGALGNNEAKITTTWSPNNQIVAFSATGGVQMALGRQEIYLIDTNGEVADSLVVDGSNFEAIWAPSGKAILYSVANSSDDYRPVLWYSLSDGSKRAALDLPTWAEKCTFQNEVTAYCAVPRSAPIQSGNDHRLITAYDDVYVLNLSTGLGRLFTSPITNVQMFNLSVSSDGSILYFSDQYGRLNSIPL